MQVYPVCIHNFLTIKNTKNMGKFKDLGIPRYQLMEELAELSTECTEIIKLLAKKERFEAKFDETRIGKKETRLREITEKMNSLFEEMIDVKYSYKRFLDETVIF